MTITIFYNEIRIDVTVPYPFWTLCNHSGLSATILDSPEPLRTVCFRDDWT